jgi:NAD(P)-dependent dehydrogenase (short-subunit alcohol dehydrogenase family)
MSSESSKSVLVTGASSGIGNATAVYLARQGYTVLATVRKDSDVQALNNLGLNSLRPLCPLDLTKPDQVLSATNYVKEQVATHQIPSLYAVINVAGGGSISPIELMRVSDFREELEKRIVAPVMLLQDLAKFDSKRTEPTEIAKLIAKVLIVKKPKTRYQIGHMSKLGAFLEKLPQSWVDFIMGRREKI